MEDLLSKVHSRFGSPTSPPLKKFFVEIFLSIFVSRWETYFQKCIAGLEVRPHLKNEIFFESMSRHCRPVMSSSTGACGRLLRDLLSHTEHCDFNTLTTWMKDANTQETARQAFEVISSDKIRINTRVGLALCMMAMDPETTFEEGRQEDEIMSRESQRFHKTILKCLRQHEEETKRSRSTSRGNEPLDFTWHGCVKIKPIP